MKRTAVLLACLLLAALLPLTLPSPPAAGGEGRVRGGAAEGKRPMTVDDLFKFKRVSDPQISPDGKWVAYVVGTVDLEKNT
ncbi:MAG TPA: hypothetical protein VFA26_16095, partial [Gemmataceae bacterium]|nr:hypothetical protein [Gemmataceae bacterium]